MVPNAAVARCTLKDGFQMTPWKLGLPAPGRPAQTGDLNFSAEGSVHSLPMTSWVRCCSLPVHASKQNNI